MSVSAQGKFSDYIREFEVQKAAKGVEPTTGVLVYSTKRHARFEPNFMLVGGLADRLKGLISAYLFSIYAKKAFAIEWHSPCPLEPALCHNVCDWRLTTWAQPLLVPRMARHVDLIDQVQLFETAAPDDLMKLIVNDEQIVYLNTNIFSHTLCKKLFPGFEPEDVFQAAFEALFNFNVPAAFQLLWQRADASRASGLVGVHWRTGGGNGWDDPSMGEWSDAVQALKSAIADAARNGFDNPVIYFATDSGKAKEKVLAETWPVEILVAEEEASHIDRSEGNVRDGFDFALVEFMILRSCDVIYGGAGQYWMTAGLAGGKKVYRISLDAEHA